MCGVATFPYFRRRFDLITLGQRTGRPCWLAVRNWTLLDRRGTHGYASADRRGRHAGPDWDCRLARPLAHPASTTATDPDPGRAPRRSRLYAPSLSAGLHAWWPAGAALSL